MAPPVGPRPPAAAGVDDEVDADAVLDDAQAETETREIGIDAGLHGQRLDKALVAIAPEFSRSHLQSLVVRGHVRLDGQPATTASRPVRAGQRLAVDLMPTAQAQAFRPQSIALAVVHEDEHVLVLNKPAGLVVHPAPGHWSGTLLNALLAHHAGAAALPRAGVVHRLDKDTSGLMVVAKTAAAMTGLVRAIAAREVRREYQALTHGDVGAAPFTVDAPVGRDPRSRVRMAVTARGKPARTDVTPVAHGLGASAVWCRLHTGRTHQIRVHLAHRGHPLVADALYGGAPLFGLIRQALHAARLGFVHPVHGQRLQFDSPLPTDMAPAWSEVLAASGTATIRASLD